MLRVIGARQKTVTYLYDSRSGADQSSYTFSDVPLGTEHSSRIIVLGVYVGAGSGRSINRVQIGGVDCAFQAKARLTATTRHAEIWSLAVPTGTAADVIINVAGGNAIECKLAAWNLTHFRSATAADADGDDGAVASMSVSVPNRGAVVGYAYSGNGPIEWTGTGLVRDFTAGTTTATGAHSGASLADISATSSFDATVDGVGTGSTFAVLTSWG